MKIKTYILPVCNMLLICSLFFCVNASAQQQPFFINHTEAQGLSDNRVTCFYKDRSGYVWIGTENGLNRFDGRAYKIYRSLYGKNNSLSNSFITSITEDGKGNIWVSTRKGINRIDAATDTTEMFLPDDNAGEKGLPGDLCWDVFAENDSSVWMLIDSKDLVKYNPLKKDFQFFSFRNFLRENKISFTPFYHSIFRVIQKSATELWLATTEGLFSFNKITGDFRLLYGAALDKISFFYYNDKTGKLYCADEKPFLLIYNVHTGKTKIVSTAAAGTNNKNISPYHLPVGCMFVPSPEGLVLLNSKDEVLSFIKPGGSFGGTKITTLYKDMENITWIGTEKGTNRFVPFLNANLRIPFSKTLAYNPEIAMQIFTFLKDKNSWLLTSWSDNRIWEINNLTGNVTGFEKPLKYLNDTCFAFFVQGPDTLLFLGRGFFLTWFRKENTWSKTLLPPAWNKSVITCMAKDNSSQYWIGTARNGLLVYNTKSNTSWAPAKDSFSAHLIHALQYDKNANCVWIATHNTGLYKCQPDLTSFTNIKRNDLDPFAMHSSLINTICIDERNQLWAGTLEGGLAKITSTGMPTTAVNNYNSRHGLPGDNVYSVCSNNAADIFFTTGKGIGWINNTGNFKLLSAQSGLPFSDFRQHIMSLPDGKIATVSENSFFCFQPGQMHQAAKDNIILEQFDAGSVPVKPNHRLHYNENNLSLGFLLPNFSLPGAVEYYCRLDGSDKDWVYNGTQGTIQYRSLAPGKYVFHVKAKMPDGTFAASHAAWAFEIMPPFWKTWWFLLLVFLLVAGMLLWIQKTREKQIRKKAMEKSRIQQQVTELEIKALRSQMNPHFIFNSLNSISMLVAGKQNEKGLEYLSRFSKLLRMVLNESENNFVALKEEMQMLELYLQLESLRFGNSFVFYIQADELLDTEETYLPALLIHPLVENAVWHGLMQKTGERKLWIHFEKTRDGMLLCTVEDNGIGLLHSLKTKEQKANGMLHTSKGMQMVKDRLALLKSQAGQDIQLQVEETLSSEGAVTGTKISVKLPINYE